MADSNLADPVLFEARLSPYRSLSLKGFNVLMILLGIMSFVVGVVFLSLGAWPVFGFFGLDVLLLWFALRVNYRDADAYEDIRMTPVELHVRQVSKHGERRDTEFNPRWTRLEKDEDEVAGVTKVALVSRGSPLVVGSFLPPFYKKELAAGLSKALAIAKR
ncbi:MAG TPA: DUF2244 domain-containing protein [Xanthobacteraceae bacterium]|jgi:uncharacterized membrane protein|nr:DUF2244 domain-containing protein [Xanthobacteraceae bacterium]